MLMSMHSMLKYILDTVFCFLKITCWLLCQHLVQCYYQPPLTKVTLWYVVLPKKLFISYVEKDCGTPPIDIENGHLSRSLHLYNTTYNSDIHYVCYNNSYMMVGSDTVRCTEDGTWSERPICHSKSHSISWCVTKIARSACKVQQSLWVSHYIAISGSK